MINGIRKSMTDAATLLGHIKMTESGLCRTWLREGGTMCNYRCAWWLPFFFLFPKMKNRNIVRQWEREREREDRERKRKEMEDIRLVLHTMSLYISVYVTCLK
jgi:hypothetical protein